MHFIITFLTFTGYLSTIVVIISVFVGINSWFTGIFPALMRLGKGLARRKIAIFASNDNFNSLRDMLVDSNLFKEKNIRQVTEHDYKKSDGYSVLLLHWKSASAYFDPLIDSKKDATALIVYAPQDEGPLTSENIKKLNQHRNTILVNMRGRLLNDIVTSLITTSYETT